MNSIEETQSIQVIHALRLRSALEQSAMHAVNLALARWSNGDVEVEAELARALPSSRRSRWHAAAQEDFMAWLNAGGFAQQAPDGAPEAADAADFAARCAAAAQASGCTV